MKVFITDTHFCKSNNDNTVYESQMRFIKRQFNQWLDYLKETYDEKITLCHCGDVFDNRSTIGIRIAHNIQDVFLDWRDKVDEMVIIAGNHDFLTQTDRGEFNINSIDLVLSPLFANDDKVIISTQQDIYTDKHKVAFVNYNNWTYDKLKDTISKGAKTIVAHTDLANIEPDIANLLKTNNITCISGHIHIPEMQEKSYNLGSCFPLDFNDVNSKRCAYAFTDDCSEVIDKLENEESDSFIRLYDDQVLNINFDHYHKTDRFEAYIAKKDYIAGKYDKVIENINSFFTRTPNIIPYDDEALSPDDKMVINFDNYNIEQIIEDEIPTDYKEHFKKVKENIK